MRDDQDERVQALSEHLRLEILTRRMTLRGLEKKLEMGEGYLGQLLRGTVDLKVKHLLAVLAALDLEPAEFFASLYDLVPRPRQAPPPEGSWRFDYDPPATHRFHGVVPGLSAERLDEAVQQALRRLGVTPPKKQVLQKSKTKKTR